METHVGLRFQQQSLRFPRCLWISEFLNWMFSRTSQKIKKKQETFSLILTGDLHTSYFWILMSGIYLNGNQGKELPRWFPSWMGHVKKRTEKMQKRTNMMRSLGICLTVGLMQFFPAGKSRWCRFSWLTHTEQFSSPFVVVCVCVNFPNFVCVHECVCVFVRTYVRQNEWSRHLEAPTKKKQIAKPSWPTITFVSAHLATHLQMFMNCDEPEVFHRMPNLTLWNIIVCHHCRNNKWEAPHTELCKWNAQWDRLWTRSCDRCTQSCGWVLQQWCSMQGEELSFVLVAHCWYLCDGCSLQEVSHFGNISLGLNCNKITIWFKVCTEIWGRRNTTSWDKKE